MGEPLLLSDAIAALCFPTSDFKNRCGPKLIFLSQEYFQNSKKFHMSMTESLQTENYGDTQSPWSSHAEESFNQSQQTGDSSRLSLKLCQSCSSFVQIT